MINGRANTKEEIPDGYIIGMGRDFPKPVISHLYQGTYDNLLGPMCHNGANRDNGDSFSIWRGNIGEKGICKTCMKKAKAGFNHIWMELTAEDIDETNNTENGRYISVSA